MGWETDQPPIKYLKRRVIYYKKKIGNTRSFNKNSLLIGRYGKKKLNTMVENVINRYRDRINEFEKAIKLLEDAAK